MKSVRYEKHTPSFENRNSQAQEFEVGQAPDRFNKRHIVIASGCSAEEDYDVRWCEYSIIEDEDVVK